MIVWDVFPYFREEWAIDARRRLWETYAPGVDYRIVALLGDRTHRGERLPEDRNLPAGVETVMVVLDTAATGSAGDWARDEMQRDRGVAIARRSMADNDLVLLCDADEIVDPRALDAILGQTRPGPAKLAMALYTLGTRWRYREPWMLGAAFRAVDMPTKPTTQLRYGNEFPLVPDAGWHLSYQGNDAEVDAKLSAFAHAEYDTAEYRQVLARQRDRRPPGFTFEPLIEPVLVDVLSHHHPKETTAP